MVPLAPISDPKQRERHEPFYDVHPRTGASIEVFYADRAFETFGRGGVGWFGGLTGAALHRLARLPGRLLRVTQHIAMPWESFWGPTAMSSKTVLLNQTVTVIYWRRGRQPKFAPRNVALCRRMSEAAGPQSFLRRFRRR